MVDSGCIFCSIVRGEVPCYKVYEDGDVIAFLDIEPISEGHTLVVPKKHCSDIYDIPNDLLCKVMTAARKIAMGYRSSLGAKAVNLLNASGMEAGQTVFHFHVHVVPEYDYMKNRISFRHDASAKSNIEKTQKRINGEVL